MLKVKPAIYTKLTDRVGTLFERMKAAHEIAFTKQEVVELIYPVEQREIMLRAGEWLETGYSYFPRSVTVECSDPAGLLYVSYTNDKGAPLPSKNCALQRDVPPELQARFDQWLSEYVEVSRAFGLVDKVFEKLWEKCDTPEQLRYMWPAVLTLCSVKEDERLKQFGEGLREFRPPRKMPFLSPEMREACRETAATVTAAALLPADIAIDKLGDVRLSFSRRGQWEHRGVGLYDGK